MVLSAMPICRTETWSLTGTADKTLIVSQMKVGRILKDAHPGRAVAREAGFGNAASVVAPPGAHASRVVSRLLGGRSLRGLVKRRSEARIGSEQTVFGIVLLRGPVSDKQSGTHTPERSQPKCPFAVGVGSTKRGTQGRQSFCLQCCSSNGLKPGKAVRPQEPVLCIRTMRRGARLDWLTMR